jgi:hypothetical protein
MEQATHQRILVTVLGNCFAGATSVNFDDTCKEATMTPDDIQGRIQVDKNPLDGGIALAIVGLGLFAVGTILGGSAFWYAGRRWVRTQEKAPSEMLKAVLAQFANAASAGAKAASEAGSKAWNEGSVAA